MTYRVLFSLFLLVAAGCAARSRITCEESPAFFRIGPFPAADAPGHQSRIQACLDGADGAHAVFQFEPGDYVLAGPQGLRVPGHAVLRMEGARFLLDESIAEDGQAFLIANVSDVRLSGGEIIGARHTWDPGVNVAGVRITGNAGEIHIDALACRDLSSNAVGVFGAEDAPVRGVFVTNLTAVNCCNEYRDYLDAHPGPVPGSDRRDQGTVAFYYVDGWSVESSRLEGSHSDGTHFFQSRNGRFVNCTVAGSRMGGYFLEGCENVLACGNLIRDNGSRGVTIERDSRCCTLASSLVECSGREGLWMPDACSVIVADNLFIENGQKDDGDKDCEIRLDDTDAFATQTRDVRIEGNIFQSSAHQTAVIFCGPGVSGIETGANTFLGPAPQRHDAALESPK